MNRIYTGFLLIIAFALALGCGGGGSSPTNAIIAPQIVSINPVTGGPGTIVQIQGSGFGSVQGASTLSFSGVTIVPNSWSDNVISATIPTNAAADGSFVISVNGRVSNPSTIFTLGKPVLSGISPISGNPGSRVIITGTNLGVWSQTDSSVKFNGYNATIVSWTQSQIECLVPNEIQTPGYVTVVIYSSGQSSYLSFLVTIPTITSVSSERENGGAPITIFGNGFGTVPGFVTIDGKNAAFQDRSPYWTDNAIYVHLPKNFSGSSDVSVNIIATVNNRSTNSYGLVVKAPVLFKPINRASYGQPITISGLNLGATQTEGQSTIVVDGYGPVSITSSNWTTNSITFTWPRTNDIIGTKDVNVTATVGGISCTVVVTAD